LFDSEISQGSSASIPYLLKLSPGGSNIWTRAFSRIGQTGVDSGAYGVALDADQNAYLAGGLGDTVQFGGTTITSAGPQDAFLAMCDASGNCLWAVRAGGVESSFSFEQAMDIAVGSWGVLAAGRCESTSSFGSISFTNPPGWEMFVAAIDFSPPLLGINGDGGNVTLTWRAFPDGYVLESTMGPLSSSAWTTNSSLPILANGTNHLIVPGGEAQRFFRLHRR
jgi:hypothetical protein